MISEGKIDNFGVFERYIHPDQVSTEKNAGLNRVEGNEKRDEIAVSVNKIFLYRSMSEGSDEIKSHQKKKIDQKVKPRRGSLLNQTNLLKTTAYKAGPQPGNRGRRKSTEGVFDETLVPAERASRGEILTDTREFINDEAPATNQLESSQLLYEPPFHSQTYWSHLQTLIEMNENSPDQTLSHFTSFPSHEELLITTQQESIAKPFVFLAEVHLYLSKNDKAMAFVILSLCREKYFCNSIFVIHELYLLAKELYPSLAGVYLDTLLATQPNNRYLLREYARCFLNGG